MLIMKSKLDVPVSEFFLEFMHDFVKRGERKTRFTARLVPLDVICHASLESIEKAAKQLVETYFGDENGSVPSVKVCANGV